MKFKKIFNLFFLEFLVFLFVVSIGMNNHPEEVSRFLGFRYYVVLTDSMEPVIPTYSLVLTRVINDVEKIKPDTIVTFHANRMGEDVLLTHYFKQVQEKDGIKYYRTQGASAPEYDNYQTTGKDIVGEYMIHVPYIGKVILFLQSRMSWILYAELFVIWLVNITIKSFWKENEKKNTLQHI